MTALLEISDLVIRHPVASRLTAALSGRAAFVEAVAGVSFSLAAGETFALVGESGSGKTTLARGIVGLTPLHAGTVRLSGQQISGLSERRLRPFRREIGMVFQDPVGSLSPRLSIGANLAEPFRVHGEVVDLKGKIGRLLDELGLPASFVSRYPHQLSGGQLRRVGVARALALRPKLVIADEPTAGLDVSVQGEVLNLLSRLQAALGLALLLITHNLNVVRKVTDRVAVLYLGKIVETGRTIDVFRAPAHPYTHALLAANPEIDPAKRQARVVLEGEIPSPLAPPPGCRFHTRCPHAQKRCRLEEPMLRPVGGRLAACHFPLVPGLS
jgi:oligopeptide/dipeptide ABC transporter ATP-binding protein